LKRASNHYYNARRKVQVKMQRPTIGMADLKAIRYATSKACATQLCSHTFSVDLNPETSMALT